MPEDKEKMNETQYRSLVDLLNSNSEDQYRALKALKEEFGEKLDLNLKYIGVEIRDMKDVLSMHNSRLRKSEERHIRLEEREKMVKEMLAEQQDALLKQRAYCEIHKLKVGRLSTIERWLSWISKHPWQFGIIIFTIVSALLTVSNVVFHLINI